MTGTLVAWGAGMTNTGSGYEFGQSIIPAHVTNVIDFAAGGYFSMALLADVRWLCGSEHHGQTNARRSDERGRHRCRWAALSRA